MQCSAGDKKTYSIRRRGPSRPYIVRPEHLDRDGPARFYSPHRRLVNRNCRIKPLSKLFQAAIVPWENDKYSSLMNPGAVKLAF